MDGWMKGWVGSVSQYPLHLFFILIYSNYFKNVKYGYNKLVVVVVGSRLERGIPLNKIYCHWLIS
jgi:hypothetical protein